MPGASPNRSLSALKTGLLSKRWRVHGEFDVGGFPFDFSPGRLYFCPEEARDTVLEAWLKGQPAMHSAKKYVIPGRWAKKI